MMLPDLIAHLNAGRSLTPDGITAAITALTDEAVAVEDKADFLAALAAKGETVDEIHGFARELRERAVPLPVPSALRARGVLDIVGTGGDHLGTLNLSTAAALVTAAAGVPVAKHGNRAITSKSGSADVLAALGIPIELPPPAAAEALARHGFAFLLAPRYHPAFRAIAPARQRCAGRGQRTLFNLLGPLLNPARPDAQLLGVPAPGWCRPFAEVLQRLGVRRGLVVCGEAGTRPDGSVICFDELSPLGPTTVASYEGAGPVTVSRWEPAILPLQPTALPDLLGGDAAANAASLRRIFSGEDRGPRRDAVLFNAAAALWVAGRAATLQDGWTLASATLDGGEGMRKLEELRSA